MKRQRGMMQQNSAALDELDLAQTLPELYALQQIVERSDWHDDSPFQQSLRLFEWAQALPASLREIISLPEEPFQNWLTKVLDPTHGHYSMRELLAFAALVHDVGKAKTFQRLPDGATRCPGHEAVSARIAHDICARFDFAPAEIQFIITLVKSHGEPYALFKQVKTLPPSEMELRVQQFEIEHAEHFFPLLLLACGDLVTSHLRSNRPQKYAAVLSFYRRWLNRVWPEAARWKVEM